MKSRMKRREKEKEIQRTERRQRLRDKWQDLRENRRLAKQGRTNKSRVNHNERYRQIEKILSRVILVLVLLNAIVWLFIFFI